MTPAKAITISRQLGSGGDEIAEMLASRLGWRCLCRDIIDRAARSSGAPEAALAEIDELKILGLRPAAAARQAYHQAVEAIIRQAAEEGEVIIVGRGGQVVLRHQPQVLHVKIVSPPDLRVRRLMTPEGIDEEAAVNRIVASDRSRAAYLRREYGIQWLDPLLYDLVINTGLGDLSWAVDLILVAVEKKV